MTGSDPSRSRPCDRSNVGTVLAAYMNQHDMTQAQLAAKLGYDRTFISKVLSGTRQVRKVGQLREISRALDIPPERFGLFADNDLEAMGTDSDELTGSAQSEISHWRQVRQTLNHRRPMLTRLP